MLQSAGFTSVQFAIAYSPVGQWLHSEHMVSTVDEHAVAVLKPSPHPKHSEHIRSDVDVGADFSKESTFAVSQYGEIGLQTLSVVADGAKASNSAPILQSTQVLQFFGCSAAPAGKYMPVLH